MPKKSKGHNAFYYFMMDFRRREELNARYYTNLQLQEECGKRWKMLTHDEKERFEKQAKAEKGVKLTPQGVPIVEIQRQEQTARQFEENMRQSIRDYVNVTYNPFASIDDISTQIYYIIHINYYIYHETENRYIPAEIALCRFSVAQGILPNETFHRILDSGSLPTGYRFTAKVHSSEIHQIPLPPHSPPLGETDFGKVFQDMLTFIKEKINNADGKPPPLYCDKLSSTVVSDVIKDMCVENGFPEDFIKIYSLQYLFYTLANAIKDSKFQTESLAQRVLERDVYDYIQDICCPFHQTQDIFQHCSLSIVSRFAFLICEHCLHDLEMEPIPSQHMPQNMKISSRDPRSASRASKSEFRSVCASGMSYSAASRAPSVASDAPSYTFSDRPLSVESYASRSRSPPKPSRRPTTKSEIEEDVKYSSAMSDTFSWSAASSARSTQRHAFPNRQNGNLGRGRARVLEKYENNF